MKIGVYVLEKYAKQTYSNECYDVRINAGMAVVCDILRRGGYTDIDYCGAATVDRFDAVMYSVTSDCDWWEFLAERHTWPRGHYKVVVGGQGVLNVRPFLPWVDYFVLGRAEGIQIDVMRAIERHDDEWDCESVINARTFSPDRIYRLHQVDRIYPYDILLANGQTYHEDVIGCNHKCFFCGYTWHRRHAADEAFNYSGLWNGGKDRERAMIDLHEGVEVDMVKLRTTAIDGLSERLRRMVNKPITREMLREFLDRLARCEKPHQVKIYNIVGYPTETEDDWAELLEDIAIVDGALPKTDRQTSLLLHSTPFRAMPATPLACMPMSYRNYRGAISRALNRLQGSGRVNHVFYQGNAIWATTSAFEESLPTVTQSAIVWRGTEADSDNVMRIALSRKFAAASTAVKQRTLERYFDVGRLFGAYTPDTLPTRWLRTYLPVEGMWGKTWRRDDHDNG